MTTAARQDDQSEVYEIVPTIKALSIPGPFIGLHTWFLRFHVTRNGATDEPPVLQRQAGQMTEAEVEAASSNGLGAIQQSERRLDCVEELTNELKASGFEFFDRGEAWFSRRFRRVR